MDKNNKYEFILLIVTIVSCVFWIMSRTINVYENKILGAFFELAFLPMLIIFFVLPVLLLIQVFKSKKTLQSFSLFALFIQLITILFLTTRD